MAKKSPPPKNTTKMVPRRLDIEIVAVEAKFKAAERRRKAKNKLRRKKPPTSPDDLDDRTLLPDKDPVSGTLGEVREPQTIPGGEKAAPPSCDEEPTDADPSGRDEELPGDTQLPLPIQVSGPDRPRVGVPEVEGGQTTESPEIIVSSPVEEKTAVATNIGERFENPNFTQFESTASVLKRVEFESEKDRTDFFATVDKATIAIRDKKSKKCAAERLRRLKRLGGLSANFDGEVFKIAIETFSTAFQSAFREALDNAFILPHDDYEVFVEHCLPGLIRFLHRRVKRSKNPRAKELLAKHKLLSADD